MSAVAAAETPTVPAKGWLKWAIAITASLGALLEVIDVSIVNVALNDMQSTLGATLSEIGWVITGYAIANVVIIPLSAWLGAYFGKKRYFIFSMIAFVLASVLCGFATTLPMLVVARIIQGLAGGGLLAKAQSILFETFPRHELGKAQAIFGIGVIAGPAIGPTLGGYLTTNFSWPWIFFINIPVGILAVIMAITFLPEDSKVRTVSSKVDWTGIGLLIVTLASLQYLLEEGHSEDWFESGLIIKLALMASLGLLVFIWHELRSKHPAVDLRVLKHRSLVAGSIFSAVLGMSLYGALFAIPIFTQRLLGYTPMQTGMILLPGAIASAFMMPLAGILSNRVDARVLVFIGSAVLGGTMFVLQSINPSTSADSLFWPLIVRGLATVLMFLPLSLATLGPIPRADIPGASGIFSLTRQLGGSVGIAILTTLLAQREQFHRAILSEHLSVFNTTTYERLQQLQAGFVAKGFDLTTAHQQALKVMNGNLDTQALVMAFGDIFHVVGWILMVSLPLVFFLGRGSKAAPVDVH